MSGVTATSRSDSPDSRRDPSSDATIRYWSDAARHRLNSYAAPLTREAASLAQSAIDGELAALRTIGSDFRSQRNALSSVGALPAEILSRIFALHAIQQPPGEPLWDNDDSEDPPSLSQMELGWITVTHVCRRWRIVALSDPSLWTRVSFRLGTHWVDEMLSRAGPAPIIYERLGDIKSAPSPTPRETSTLSANLARIKTLVLDDDDRHGDFIRPVLQEVLTAPAPHLQHLDLSCVFAPPLSLSHAFVRVNASRLARVRLHNVILPCGPWRWDSLRVLKVNAVAHQTKSHDDHPDPRPTLHFPSEKILFSTLASMPLLERLELIGCLPQRHSDPEESVPESPLHLPHLRFLYLVGTASECLKFIESIETPILHTLGLDIRPGYNRDTNPLHDIQALVTRVVHHLERTQEPLRRLSAQASTISKFLHLRGWQSDSSLPEDEATLYLSIAFPVRGFNTAETQRQQLDVFRCIPVASVQYLQLDAPQLSWGVDQWKELTRMFTSASDIRIVLSSMSSAAFADTLVQTHNEPKTQEATPEVFPSLSTLELEGMHFQLPDEYGSHRLSSRLSDKLQQALKQRKVAGLGPRVLRMRKCTGIDNHTVARLKEIVPVLDWDRFKEPHAEVMDFWT